MLRTAYIYDPLFLSHYTGSRHPECSERLTSAHAMLSRQEWFDSLHQYPTRKASPDTVQLIHDPGYIDRVQRACESGVRHIDTPMFQFQLHPVRLR